MNRHTYLRAYMAGIVVPSIAMVLGVTVFGIARYAYSVPIPIERVMIFPMAVVPPLWGLWNMLFVASHARTHLSLGFHGALLPFLLGPLGILLTLALNFQVPGEFQIANFATHVFPVLAVVVLTLYYLLWKYAVGFLNGVLGIA